MSRRGTNTFMALLLVISGGTLLASGAGAAHGSKTRVVPVERFATLSMPGSNGWHLHVGAVLGSRPQKQQLGAQALGRHGQSVSYTVRHAYTTPGGTIKEKLPGVGRIAVQFEQAKERQLRFSASQGCASDGVSVERSGWFTGTIEFHGEGGYTDLSRRRAHGQIMEFPREVCHGKAGGRGAHGSSAGSGSVVLLTASRDLGHGRRVAFSANPISELGPVAPSVNFSASYYHSRRGMFIWASTRVRGGVRNLSVVDAAGSPSEATVEPPHPFSGSAVFKLETPTKASWTGDLTTEVPTLGDVSLTGPGFWSAICTFEGCTKTLPPGVQIIR
jgi:hypothetical protein